MTDQVTSIEQSKRLVELGVPADKASLVYRKRYIKRDYVLDVEDREMEVIAPAFTVSDLLGIIKPIDIGPDTCNPCLEKKGNEGEWRFEFGQILGDEDFGYDFNHSLIDLLVGRIEWIVSNGYKLNI